MSRRLAPLQLPFRGSWFVFWGGNTQDVNVHHNDQAQKYALDLIVLDKESHSFSNKGEINKDYYAFGQDILTSAPGEVIEAVDGLRDNQPRKTTNNYAYHGNFVLIKHTEELHSVYAHLKQYSLAVKIGDKLELGQKIGECGNSGNSTEPHLHFHLQDSDVLTTITGTFERKPHAKAVRPYFGLWLTNKGKKQFKNSYSPVKGDFVSPN